MSTGTGDPYRDSQTRHLTDDELLRGLDAIERLETSWFLDPARVEDLKTLRVRCTSSGCRCVAVACRWGSWDGSRIQSLSQIRELGRP